MSIPVGICLSPKRVPDLAPGYDYLELGVSSDLVPLKEDFFPEPLQALRPPVRAFNVFVPKELKLVGPNVHWEQVELYVQRALSRAKTVGGQVIVFGSGGARRVPEGFSKEEAWNQIKRFLTLCANYAEKNAIIIAIEPLNQQETNILNTYAEAVEMARQVNRKPIRVLADIYHFVMEEEPLEHIRQAPEWLAHVHLADSGRYYPGSGTYPLKELFEILHEIDYQGMVSIECRWRDLGQESREALAYVRSLVG